MSLQGRRILLGVAGGIAAYKTAELIRLLTKQGAQVRVVMTASATHFMTPLTLATLSQHPVALDGDDLVEPMRHIDWVRWADLFVIAPATAQRIALLAHGNASDLLSTMCLAAECPVVVCPAMNRAMWSHPATVNNVEQLRQYGLPIWGPELGEQACGETGEGRLLAPSLIVEQIQSQLNQSASLQGQTILLTAGPTVEAIDPVRYLSNHSSGKMGYALASSAVAAGATVVLVSGPVSLAPPAGVTIHHVTSAIEMHDRVHELIHSADIFIGCAAVADYRPAVVPKQKMKKSASPLQLDLVPNVDIIKSLQALDAKPFIVGFSAETENVEAFASQKRIAKGMDLIMANRVSETEGFGCDENAVTVIGEHDQIALPKQPKTSLADSMITIIADTFKRRKI